jgi:hypothetical protein
LHHEVRCYAIEKSGYDGMTVKHWKKSTQEVISDREEGGIQKMEGQPQRRGLSAAAEGSFTTEQAGRD